MRVRILYVDRTTRGLFINTDSKAELNHLSKLVISRLVYLMDLSFTALRGAHCRVKPLSTRDATRTASIYVDP